MKRLDESVNQLSLDGLKEGLFQGSWDPVTLEASDSNIHYFD